MILVDTHTHIYLKEFDSDRDAVIKKSINEGVKYLFLPNIDSTSVNNMISVCKSFPDNCFPFIGLHPTSVKGNFQDELNIVDDWIRKYKFFAVGETGIDLYWDKSYAKEQEIAFRHQIELSLKYDLPIIIHSRNSIEEIISIVSERQYNNLRGIFHCFPGSADQAHKIINLGFLLGIGGVVTFKNSSLSEVVRAVELKNIVFETDSPYLAPVPFRGKRNESSYIKLIAKKVAEIKDVPTDSVAEITTQNAKKLFDSENFNI